jgi:cytochrome c oxidase subunit 2
MSMKKILHHALLVAASAGLFLQQTAIQSAAPEMRNDEQVIRISASTFEFKPSEITVKKGVPVTLELISQDRHHGFKLSEFHLRADIQPGVVEKVRFVPDKIGNFTFFCDVFCGDGHEDMSGTLTVIE